MRISRASISFLIAVVVVSAPGSLQAQSAAKPDTVRLRFGWRPGMQAWVDYQAMRSRVGGGRDQRTQVACKWRLSVSAHAKGLAIRTDSVQVTSSLSEPAVERLAQRLAVMAPVHLVSRRGEFVGIEDVAGFRVGMVALVDSLLAGSPGAPTDTRAMFEKIYSDAVVQATAAESWNAMVGAWTLGDIELGERYVAETSAPSPVMPQLQIPLALEFSALRRVSCQKSGNRDCVEITMSSYPDSAKAREAMAQFFKSLKVADSEKIRAMIESSRSEVQLTTVTRPDGLRPQSVVSRKRVTVTGEEGGKRVTVAQEDVKTYRFRWVK